MTERKGKRIRQSEGDSSPTTRSVLVTDTEGKI